MPEPRFSGVFRTAPIELFPLTRHVPRRSISSEYRHTAAFETLQLDQAAHVVGAGSSTRSAPSPAPARHYAPASRPCARCSAAPKTCSDADPNRRTRSCCLASRARSTACCGAQLAMDSGSATPSPNSRRPVDGDRPSGKPHHLRPQHPKPCLSPLGSGYRRGLPGCRASAASLT